MNGETDFRSVADIEIGMAGEKGFRLGRGRLAKTVDIMMAVALGVGNTDQRAKRQILLHTKTGLAGQVSAGDKGLVALRAPSGGAGSIDHRLVDALAGL